MSGARTVGVRWTTDFHRRVITMRDLQKDLELCQKATRGPWIALPAMCGPDGMEVYQVESMGCICLVGDPRPRGENRPTANMHFIAAAREGWPHAIDRALKAEAEVEKLRDEVERLKLLEVREEVLYDFATKYLCPWETECLKPFHDASDCVDCWEKFLEREEARKRG
jgi:hypothetical protein